MRTNIKGEPYFKYWRITALENYGDVDVRFNSIGLYCRSGGPELTQYAIDIAYTGGFSDISLIAPIANQPSVTFKFFYPIAARQVEFDYTIETLRYTLSPTWTMYTTGNGDYGAVCWSSEKGLFVAVGSHINDVIISNDGVVWSGAPIDNNLWRDIIWIAQLGLFVIVSSTGAVSRVRTSPDAITWTQQTSLLKNWYAIAYSPSLNRIVIVSQTGSAGSNIARSSDGINWSYVTFADVQSWNSVCWSPQLSKFLMVAQDGANRSAISSDGITWSGSNSLGTTANWVRVAWSPDLGIFVAVGAGVGNFSKKAWSADGVTWNLLAAETTEFVDLVWSDGMKAFFAMSDSSAQISSDGLTWTAAPAFPMGGWKAAAWSDDLALMCAVGNPGGNPANTAKAMINIGIPSDTSTEDAPRVVKVEVSNNNREYFELETFEDLVW